MATNIPEHHQTVTHESLKTLFDELLQDICIDYTSQEIKDIEIKDIKKN